MAFGAGGWGGTGSSWRQPTPMNPQTQPMQQALSFMTGMHGADFVQNDMNASRLAGQLGYNDAQYQMDTSFMQENAGLDRQRLGLAGQNIGIDRNALNRQIGVNDQLQGLAQQLFGLDIRGLGIQNAGLGIDRQSLAAQLVSQFRGLDNDKRNMLSEKTAMGSVGSVMHRRGNAENQAQREDVYGQFGRDSAGLDLKQDQIGLDAERVGIGRQQSDIEFGENKAKLQDRMKTLDTEASKLGIDRKQLEINLNQGLARLGIDRMFSMNDILDAMTSNDIERQAIAQQIFREAMGMSQFMPQAPGPQQPQPNPLSNNTPAQNQQVTNSAVNQLSNAYNSGRMITG